MLRTDLTLLNLKLVQFKSILLSPIHNYIIKVCYFGENKTIEIKFWSDLGSDEFILIIYMLSHFSWIFPVQTEYEGHILSICPTYIPMLSKKTKCIAFGFIRLSYVLFCFTLFNAFVLIILRFILFSKCYSKPIFIQ